jgi:DNA-binding response OmpR family regulator
MTDEGPRLSVLLVGYGSGTPALVSALERSGLVVTSFASHVTALAEVERVRPDVVLVGDADEGDAPFNFIADLRAAGFRGVLLFLTPSVDRGHVSKALSAGAHDVVAPPHSLGAILLRRHVVEERRRHPRPFDHAPLARQLNVAGLTIDLATREVSDGGEPFSLSRRELDLLVRLIEARGDVVPRERLLAEIWGNEQESEAVLDATVHRLRKRLEERTDKPDILKTVRGVGYRLLAG